MGRWLVLLIAGLTAVVTVGVAPHATAEGAILIGNLGDTLPVEVDDIVADVTVRTPLP
jgi:hypothetical protein